MLGADQLYTAAGTQSVGLGKLVADKTSAGVNDLLLV